MANFEAFCWNFSPSKTHEIVMCVYAVGGPGGGGGIGGIGGQSNYTPKFRSMVDTTLQI